MSISALPSRQRFPKLRVIPRLIDKKKLLLSLGFRLEVAAIRLGMKEECEANPNRQNE